MKTKSLLTILFFLLNLFIYAQTNEISFKYKTIGSQRLLQMGKDHVLHLTAVPKSKGVPYTRVANICNPDLEVERQIKLTGHVNPYSCERTYWLASVRSNTAYFVQVFKEGKGCLFSRFDTKGNLSSKKFTKTDYLENAILTIVSDEGLFIFKTKDDNQKDPEKWRTEKIIMNRLEGDAFTWRTTELDFPDYYKKSPDNLEASAFWQFLYYDEGLFCFGSPTVDFAENLLRLDMVYFNERGERAKEKKVEIELDKSFFRFSFAAKGGGSGSSFLGTTVMSPSGNAFYGFEYDYQTKEFYIFGLTGDKNLKEIEINNRLEISKISNTGYYIAKFDQNGKNLWLKEIKAEKPLASEMNFKVNWDYFALPDLSVINVRGDYFLIIDLGFRSVVGSSDQGMYYVPFDENGKTGEVFALKHGQLLDNPFNPQTREFKDYISQYPEKDLQKSGLTQKYFVHRYYYCDRLILQIISMKNLNFDMVNIASFKF